MRAHHRPSCLAAIAAIAYVLSACAGASSSSTSSSSTASGSPPVGESISDVPFLTPWPTGNEDPENLYLYADNAFRAGDLVTAQRSFGTLYIVAPTFGNGIAQSALLQTCGAIGNDCGVMFARLDFVRDAFYGAWGPRREWVPQQDADFRSIVTCYDRVLVGDFQGARANADRALNAPLPGFASNAQRCAAWADQGMVAAVRTQQIDQAVRVWLDHYDCMASERRALLAAYDLLDWDAFVDAWPQYQLCATELQDVIDSRLLEGHPQLGPDTDMAWTDMSEIDFIMAENRATYERTRDGLIALDADPQYNRLVVEWNQLAFEELRLGNQIASVEMARDALQGDQRRGVENQVEALQSEQRDVRRRMREIMGEVNVMRSRLGLEAREQP